MKLHLVSLGCARNLVDSENMLGQLKQAGWAITQEPAQAQIIIVNTCSFIESAVNESIDTILELAKFKHHGNCRHLIVAGCLPERYREEIVQSLPEVDLFLGTGALDKIVQAVEAPEKFKGCLLPNPDSLNLQNAYSFGELSSRHMAYLKIAEGCNRTCTYCIIPKLRGKQKSRPLEDLVAEARHRIASGVKELVLIAQDTTNYGKDLTPPYDLSRLLNRLVDISDGVWIRFLYGHPDSINEKMIQTVAQHSNICSYFDIPIQHASDKVLKRMGRRHTRDDLFRLFEKIRLLVPQVALRTTAIVGFPGETDNDFQQLLSFTEEVRFDHLGVFTYSDSEDLVAHKLSNHIPPDVAKARFDELMSCQREISLDNNQKYIGRVVKVLLEAAPEDNVFLGRTHFQAPEVDGLTYIHSKHPENELRIGSFTSIRITDALEYDLIGEAA
jgi:ribosomal protein S12 methylthiotransferase